jgi:hypothetical protein
MLPVFFQNIPYYKIDDIFTFSGDLIITSGIVYYFPNTDLEQERIYRGGEAEASLPGFKALGDLFTKVLANFELSQTTPRSQSWKTVVWKWGDPIETFQSRLDTLIAESKRKTTDNADFASTLPIPSRFATNSIRQMKIDRAGVLSFEAFYDRHDFNIGVEKKRDLQDALLEGGFVFSVF